MSGRRRGGQGQKGDGGGYGGPPRQQGGPRQRGSGSQGQHPQQGGRGQTRGPRGSQQHGESGQSGSQGQQPRQGGQFQQRSPRGSQHQGGSNQPSYHQGQQFRQGPRHEQGPGPRSPRQDQDRPLDQGFQLPQASPNLSGGFPAPAWGPRPEPAPQQAPVQSASAAWGRRPEPPQEAPVQSAPAAWGRRPEPAPQEAPVQSAPAAWGRRPEPAPQQAPVQPAPVQPSSAAPAEAQPKGKRKGKRKGSRQQAEQAAPTPTPAVPPTPAAQDNVHPTPAEAKPGKKKEKGKSEDKISTQPAAPTPLTSEVGDVAKKTENLTLHSGKFNIPQRPEEKVALPGAKTLLIEVNYLPLRIKDRQLKIYHYDVNFNPDKPKYLLRDALEQMRVKHFENRHPAFDGMKNMYVAGKPLNDKRNVPIRDSVTVQNEESGQDKEFDVTIKLVNENVDLDRIFKYCKEGITSNIPQTEIQATDIALRSHLTNSFTPVGRSFFKNPGPKRGEKLGCGMELWHGFYQSAIAAWKPYLNIDVANKAFPIEQEVLEFIRYDLKYDNFDQGLDQCALRGLEKFIKGLKISYKIPNPDKSAQKRVYKVTGLGGTPIQEKFKLRGDGPEITVGEYYQTEKKHTIKYPRLPLLKIGTNGSMVPIECCSIVGNQAVMRKLDEKQTGKMVKAAARSTTERKDRIYDCIDKANYENNPTLKEFGIEVQTSFEKVEAVVIKPPKIKYRRGEASVVNGVWRLPEKDHFFVTKDVPPWAVLNLDRKIQLGQIRYLEDELKSVGINLGMNFPLPQQSVTHKNENSLTENEIENYLKKFDNRGVKLVIVILSTNPEIYGRVKRASELRTGVLTQCIKSCTVEEKVNFMTVTNILLKLNAKLTGVNHTLAPNFKPEVLKKPFMVVGADVTHPAPGSEGSPSIAAVAASQDVYGFQYKMLYSLQPSREEMILELAEMMKEQIEYFNRKFGRKPEKIFYFRDGVSEGQFQKVLEVELVAIKNCCRAMGDNYEPAITFLVVQKRHHTRFFPNPKDTKISDPKNYNVPAGTLVDKQITHPTEIDFYLVSHKSIQGTARPTKYHLLWDDSNIKLVDLEILTYYLCHMFSRCMRSVSYPAPTYYAHLAAFRARAWWDNQAPDMANLKKEQENRGKIVNNMLNTYPMFFT